MKFNVGDKVKLKEECKEFVDPLYRDIVMTVEECLFYTCRLKEDKIPYLIKWLEEVNE